MNADAHTLAMQSLWDRAMLIARTRGAYGAASFPEPGTSFPLPTPNTMLHDILFVAAATDEEYEARLAEIRADMTAWKARVRASGGKRRELITDVDLSKVEFDL